MKKILSLLGLICLVLLTPVALFAAAAAVSGSLSASTTTVTVGTMDQNSMIAMVRPMLENYSVHHPDDQVRIWSMVVLAHLKDVDQNELLSIPTLVQQMGNRDENIRLIAMDTIRQALNLDDDAWKGIMQPVLLTIIKTAKYPEVRKLAIKALGAVKDLDKQQLSGLPLLFEVAQDPDAEIRQAAQSTIEGILAELKSGGGGGGGGPR